MAAKPLPSREVLSQLLEYNPDTGVFWWRSRTPDMFEKHTSCKRWNTRFSGMKAGTVNEQGYVILTFLDRRWQAHRVAFAMMGRPVPVVVDHINRDRSDNRFMNLRPSSHSENSRNNLMREDNKSGVSGVSWYPITGKWRVTAANKHVGYFKDLSEAIEASRSARISQGITENTKACVLISASLHVPT